MNPDHGHRAIPHTADVIIEAWAADFEACCREAVVALIQSCVDGSRASVCATHRFTVASASPDAILLDVLDEVIFVLDTETAVPVDADVVAVPGGGLEVELTMADRRTVRPTGSAPKAVSRSGLTVLREDGRFLCSFLVDV
jgi:SHS2 domain-containing protein